jgi:HSP20 family protein
MALQTGWPFFEDRFRWADELFKAFSPPSSLRGSSAGVLPALNLYDDGQAFVVRAEVPGIDKDSIDVTVQGDQLTLRGERRIQPADPQASYHRREREGGQFRRVLSLPQMVDANRISATYKNGVLEVVLPRVPEVQPRRIAIQ